MSAQVIDSQVRKSTARSSPLSWSVSVVKPIGGVVDTWKCGGPSPLELELPDADQRLEPGPLVALGQCAEVPLDRVAVWGNGQPVAGVGQRKHRREAAGPVDKSRRERAAGRAGI